MAITDTVLHRQDALSVAQRPAVTRNENMPIDPGAFQVVLIYRSLTLGLL